MTYIAEDGGRTVTNCFVHDRRKVYEMTASVVLDVVRSECNEVVKTGMTVTKDVVYHVIATSEDYARLLFQTRWGSEFQRHTLKSVKVLFCIDEEISTRHD
jgi:hypothetical protein